jgi:hypothetical protein
MSSTDHWPLRVVHPTIPLASKSKLSVDAFCGTLTSGGADASARRHEMRDAAAAASANVTICRREVSTE